MTAQIIPVPVFDLVVFGATGDLSYRKLMPALYWRERDQQMPADSRIIAVARAGMTTAAYLDKVEAACREHVDGAGFEPEVFQRLAERMTYVSLDVARGDNWPALAAALEGGEARARLFYLATSPDLFGPISAGAGAAGIVTPLTRVVLEKPIGKDLASAIRINDAVAEVFEEGQIYRIDHYLGKESVQNLLALRFANSLFEPVWNRSYIDHVQVTVAETVGVEERAAYYDQSGALRDMVQNHILQLLCLVAMEPPTTYTADSVRDEKLKVLRALKPIGAREVTRETVRGQYRAGAADGQPVRGYLDELGQASDTETFVALKAEVENWRWAGVPFYLRTGKRLPARVSEIVIQFREVPHPIFPVSAGQIEPNRLVIRLQPDDGIQLALMAKDPGPGGLRLRPANLDIRFADAFKVRYPDAYERLLMDVVRGNATLFMRRDEVEAAWRWVEPIIAAWGQSEEAPKPYIAGTWGPTAAIALIERDGRTWFEDNH
ncbi:MAG: glucose-6-phosphate dehydrogenase [Geminicoccaceae bacterium]